MGKGPKEGSHHEMKNNAEIKILNRFEINSFLLEAKDVCWKLFESIAIRKNMCMCVHVHVWAHLPI